MRSCTAATSAMTFAPPSVVAKRPCGASGARGEAVAAMVVRVGVEAAGGEEIGETGIARRVLGKPVVDLDDGTGRAGGCGACRD